MEENNTLEILKQAILLEKRGKAFYQATSEKTEDPDVREIFSLLAREEDAHIRFLAEQYKNYQNEGGFRIHDLPEDQSGSVASLVLTDNIREKISAAGFEAAAIAAAIDMENKAIAVYSGQAEQANDPEEKRFYQWLADWERGHHKLLYQLDQELKEKIWNDNRFWPF